MEKQRKTHEFYWKFRGYRKSKWSQRHLFQTLFWRIYSWLL